MRSAHKVLFGVLLGVSFAAGQATAQFKNGSQATELKLPELSQQGTVTQVIGLTNITIDYHRPLAAGREVLGRRYHTGKCGEPARMRTRQ